MIVNKAHLIRHISARKGITQKLAKEIVRVLIESMTSALSAGEDITIRGFGRFSVKKRAQRFGRNFGTGEPMVIGRRNSVVFHASPALKAWLNQDMKVPERLGPFPDRRSEQRINAAQSGRAVVRVAGIPVFDFEIKDISEGGTSFVVENEPTLLRNIRVGQEIDLVVNVQDEKSTRAVFQRSQIRHITQTRDSQNGNTIAIGVKILSQLL